MQTMSRMSTFCALAMACFAALVASSEHSRYRDGPTTYAIVEKFEQSMGYHKDVKIVGGQPAPVGRYLYHAGLKFSAGATFPGCGGTLIAPNVVYSAAHCAGASVITVGCYDLNNAANEPDCETFDILSETLHPGFSDFDVPRDDFMILILDGESVHTPMAFLAPTGFEVPDGYDVTTIGWGTTQSGGSQSSILLEVEVDYITNEQCAAEYDASQPGLVDDTMLCASRPGKDACQGDSGGAIFARCDLFGEDIHLGTTSWGFGCADPNFAGVYGRTSVGFDFIAAQVAAQGFSLATPPSLDTFCTLGGTFAPTFPTPAPTPAPTVPDAWTCFAGYYDSLDGCDCECGVPDPDCEVAGQTLFGCDEGQICSPEGFCVDEYEYVIPTPVPTEFPTQFPTNTPPTTLPPSFFPTRSPVPAPSAAPPTTSEPFEYIVYGIVIGFAIAVFCFMGGAMGSKFLAKRSAAEEDVKETKGTVLVGGKAAYL